jgi:hypothetical protein
MAKRVSDAPASPTMVLGNSCHFHCLGVNGLCTSRIRVVSSQYHPNRSTILDLWTGSRVFLKPQVSFPEWSLSPFVERTWASVYEALKDGQIDAERRREGFLHVALLPQAGEVVFLEVDTSTLYRPEAETAEDRTGVPIATAPKNTPAASPGWVRSHVVLVPKQAGQGTVVLDTARVRSTELATEVAARHLRAVVTVVVARGRCPIILGDRWSACAPLLTRMANVDARCLLRVTSNRVFSHPAPARVPGPVGASRKDGDLSHAQTRAATAQRMYPGKGSPPKGRGSRRDGGSTRTCAPRAGWRSRSSRSSATEPVERLVTQRSASWCGKAISLCL